MAEKKAETEVPPSYSPPSYDGTTKPRGMAEVLAHIGGAENINRFTQEMAEFMESEIPQFLWINPGCHHRYGWCTSCRARVDLKLDGGGASGYEHWKHGETVTCPVCGREVTVLTRNKQIWQDVFFYWWEKSAINPNAIVARGIWAEKGMNRDKAPRPSLDIRTDDITVFIYGKGAAMISPYHGAPIRSWLFDTEGPSYQMVKRVHSRWNTYGSQGQKCLYLDNWTGLEDAAADTPFRYFEHGPYDDGAVIKALYMFTKYPAWEWLSKMGLSDVLERYARDEDQGEAWRVLNFKGKTVDAIFRKHVTKADKRYIFSGKVVNVMVIDAWQFWKMHYPDALLEEVDGIDRLTGRTLIYNAENARMMNIYLRYKPKKLLAYIEKQEQAYGAHIRMEDIMDYLDELAQLHYDMKDRDCLYPKDFQKSHEHTAATLAALKNKAEEEKYQKRRGGLLKKYNFQDVAHHLMVVVPENLASLKTEGMHQHNCVGTYMRRVSDGGTDVVFVRRADHPEDSYITVEVEPQTGRVVQARTRFNHDIEEQDAKDFMRAFEEHTRAYAARAARGQ